MLKIAYDGTRYMGWQKTDTGPSIEQELEDVLETILQHKVSLQAASRTDRGVHAKGQIVNFFTPKSVDLQRLQKSLNQLLPDDIAVKEIASMPCDFHPTLHTKGKEYHYFILQGCQRDPLLRATHWHILSTLNIDNMQKAALCFLGRHDFKAFCNQRKGLVYEHTIREIFSLNIIEDENRLKITIRGDHFLYKMARNIVGTLVSVGLNTMSPEMIPLLFEQKERTLAGVTAPAMGLLLDQVFYEDLT